MKIMRGGIKLGKIIGIPIRLDYSWFIIFGLISFSLSFQFSAPPSTPIAEALLLGLFTTLLFFGSVLLHELAHSYVAIHRGLPVAGITLFVFGGVSLLEEEPKSPRVEFQMAVVGPLTSLLIAFLLFPIARFLLPYQSQSWKVVTFLWEINLALGIFNLLPGFPLDGGRILRSIVWYFTGSLHKATRAASSSGQAFGYLLIAMGIINFFRGGEFMMNGIWFAFIGWFLLNAAQQAYQQLLAQETFFGVKVGQLPLSPILDIQPDMSVQAFVDEYLLRHSENLFPILVGGEFIGAVGLKEVQELARDKWATTAVKDIARHTCENDVIGDNGEAWEAVQRLGHNECECLFVMHEQQLQGVLTRANLVNWIRTRRGLGMYER